MRIIRIFRLPRFRSQFLRNLAPLKHDRQGFSHFASVAVVLLTLSLPMHELAIGQSSDQQIEISFRAGQAALKQGDFHRATEEFKKVLSLDPGLLEAEVNLGLAYQGLFDYDAAARSLSHALQERPDLHGPNILVGMDYLKLGSPEKAAPYIRHALQLDPSSLDAHGAMALYYLTQENLQGAIEQYRKVADLDPDKAEALFRMGHQYLEMAGRLAYRGARLYPDSSWGHRFLGDMLLERNRWEDACARIPEGPRHRTSAIRIAYAARRMLSAFWKARGRGSRVSARTPT